MKIYKVFDALSLIFFILIILMILTGGHTFIFGKNKVEMVAVDLWVLACIVFGLIFYRLSGEKSHSYQLFDRFLIYCVKNQKTGIYFLISMISVLFLTHWGKHWSLNTDAWDMGFIHPALYQPFENPLLKCDLCLNNTYLGEHLSFTMFIPALFFQYIKSDVLVFLLQSILIGAGAYLIFFKGPLKALAKSELIIIALLMFFCSRALRNSLFWDFREDHLAFFFLSLSLVFLFYKKIIPYFFFLIMTLISKEHIGLMTFFLSIPIYFEKSFNISRKERMWVSILTAVISFSYVILAFKVLIPIMAKGNQGHNNIVYLFGEYGTTPSEVLKNVLLSPSAIFSLASRIFLNFKAIKYLIIILGGVVFLGYKRIWWIAPVLAGLFLNLLPKADEYKMMIFHYELAVYPYIGFWIALSISELDFHKDRRRILASLIVFVLLSGRWPINYLRQNFFKEVESVKVLNQIDSNRIVLANSKILSHLNHFKGIRPLRIPENWNELNDQELWQNFVKSYESIGVDSGRSRPNNFEVVIFDLRRPVENKLSQMAQRSNWQILKEFKDSKFLMGYLRGI